MVQQLVTYRPFYKNVTSRGPLPIKWCIKQYITLKTIKEDMWVCHWNYHKIAMYYNCLSVGCLWLRLLWHRRFIVNTSVSGASYRLSSSVSSAIGFLFWLASLQKMYSHTHVFTKIECIFSAKSFSLGNLSLLTSFQKLSTISNTVIIVHFY